METREAIKKRRSQRSFLDKPIEKKMVKRLLELSNLAPTAMSMQNRRVVVVTNKLTRKQLYKTGFRQSQLLEAPVILVFTTDFNLHKPEEFLKKSQTWGTSIFNATPENFKNISRFSQCWKKWSNLWPVQDVDAAITTLMLAAVEKGLTTCWVGLFDNEAVEKILGLPKNQNVIALICLGHSDKPPKPQHRKPIEELIHWEKW